MRCARCRRHLQAATVTLAGVPFGPRCAELMGLMPSVRRAAKTQHRPVKRKANRYLKCQLGEVQDGQIELFEELAA